MGGRFLIRWGPLITGGLAGSVSGGVVLHPLAAVAGAVTTGAPPMEVILQAYHPAAWGLFLFHLLTGAAIGMGLAAILAAGFRAELAQERQAAHMRAQLLQAQRMESIGRLSSGVAHDFNNLLSALTIRLHLARKQLRDGDAAAKPLAEAQRIAMKAGELPKHLLDFARRDVHMAASIDLGRTIDDLRPLLQYLTGEGVTIKVDLSKGCHVLIAPAQFEQVLMNLAVNARDAMDGVGTLSISLAPRLRQVDTQIVEEAVLTISDDGPGVPAEIRGHVFDAFFTTKNTEDGTGLGLSTCQGIIAQHGGTIHVEDADGGGAAFVITFPLEPVQADLEDTLEAANKVMAPV